MSIFGKKNNDQQPTILYSANCSHTCSGCGGCHTISCSGYTSYCEESLGGGTVAKIATQAMERARQIEQRSNKKGH